MFDSIKKSLAFIFFLFTFSLFSQPFKWAVVGGGLAGITSIVVLLEQGINGKDILWIDPEFNVGRLGKYYGNVPSNQKAYRFTRYLDSSFIFRKLKYPSLKTVKKLDQQKEPLLQYIINPLLDITDYIKDIVTPYKGLVTSLITDHSYWRLELSGITFYAYKVILAVGSHPKKMAYEGITEIPLDLALDEYKLKKMVDPNDTVLIIGSAHSALLVLKYLAEFPVKKAINVYNKKPTFGTAGGLEGITAWWTKEVLEKNPPVNIQRVLYQPGIIEEYIKESSKIIYAFGYERNPLIVNGSTDITYDNDTGIIKPNLYGIGIAFPQRDRVDDKVYELVGVNSFMGRAKKLIPQWMKEN